MTESAAGQSETLTTLFRQATGGNDPLPYQIRLALAAPFPSLLDVPTGLGKTAAAVFAWLWRRRFANESVHTQTPRQLDYCLPTRSLVIQPVQRLKTYFDALKAKKREIAVAVHQLMGGTIDDEWMAHTDQPWAVGQKVVIGEPRRERRS